MRKFLPESLWFLARSVMRAGSICLSGIGIFNFCKKDCGTVHEREITINKQGIVFIKNVQRNAQIMMGNYEPTIYFSGVFSNPLYMGKDNVCQGDTLVFKGGKIFCTYGGKIKANSEFSELY